MSTLELNEWPKTTAKTMATAIKFIKFSRLIDDYAKDGDQRWSDIYVVFAKILCGRNFCAWSATKLKFAGQLQMASLSLYP